MYIEPKAELSSEEQGQDGIASPKPSLLLTGVLAVMVLGVIFVGVFPFPVVEAIEAATTALAIAG
jgi:hypothetical protein